jgi:hypothetical protein
MMFNIDQYFIFNDWHFITICSLNDI